MAFLAGERITAGRLNSEIPSVEDDQYITATGAVSTTSGSYTTLTGDPAAIFVAPRSGKVTLRWGASTANGDSTTLSMMSVEVRQGGTVGSGTVELLSDDLRAVIHEGTLDGTGSFEYTLPNLNEGATYNARVTYKRYAGTGSCSWSRRWISASSAL